MGSFDDHREHNVHDDDSADHHEDTDDGDGGGGNRAGHLIPGGDQGIGGEEAEVIGLARRHVSPSTEQRSDLVLGLFEVLPIHREGGEANAHATAVDFEVGFGRDDREAVAGLAEHAALLLGYADDGIGATAEVDDFPDRVDGWKKLLLHLVTDDGDHHPAGVVGIGEKPALGDLGVGDDPDVGGDPTQFHFFHPFGGEVHGDLAVRLDADFAQQFGFAFQEVELLAGKLWVSTLHFEELLRVPLADHDHAADAKAVDAHDGDLGADVVIHAADHAHDGDQGGGG